MIAEPRRATSGVLLCVLSDVPSALLPEPAEEAMRWCFQCECNERPRHAIRAALAVRSANSALDCCLVPLWALTEKNAAWLASWCRASFYSPGRLIQSGRK